MQEISLKFNATNTAHDYDILLGNGLMDKADVHIASALEAKKARPISSIHIITDTQVSRLYSEKLQKSLLATYGAVPLYEIILTEGEQSKSFAHLASILDQLLARGIDRDGLLIALGGVVVGDITGFAAAITLRGIRFIQIPTSLLAMVDSSVGGKTGINSTHGKNLIGAFKQPEFVLMDGDILSTLSKRELKAGYAEIVKYGVINDEAFFTWLETNGNKVLCLENIALHHALASSVKAKAAIVAKDEKEAGERALLNLGHSFGHALEAAGGYDGRILHGEAVAIGIVMALKFSALYGLITPEEVTRLQQHFQHLDIKYHPNQLHNITLDKDQLTAFMTRDKKTSHGRITLILARAIGQSFLCRDYDFASLNRFWDHILQEQI